MIQQFLQNIEEQNISFGVNGRSFSFRFFAFRELMYVDIERNGVKILNAKRVMANQWLLPNYIAKGIGNLRFETYKADGDDYVWYDGFNTKFRLMTYTDAEIQELESSTIGTRG